MALHDFRITPYRTDHTGDTPSRVRNWTDSRKMFETTAVDSRKRRWRGVFWSMLPASLLVHAAVGLAIIAVQTWEVSFPPAPPPTIQPYLLMVALAVPPPPPPPPAAAAARTEPMEKLPDNVAPNAIPEEVPEFIPPPTEASSGVDSGVEGGIEGGEIGGMVGGTEGGVMPPEPPPIPDTIVIARDEKLPLKALSMTYPIYPDKWRLRNIEDSLVLRYRIDKKGRVVETVILVAPRFKEFAEASVDAIRYWRFRPLTINGEAKEVVHELTINFKIERPEPRVRRTPAAVPPVEKPGEGDRAKPPAAASN